MTLNAVSIIRSVSKETFVMIEPSQRWICDNVFGTSDDTSI